MTMPLESAFSNDKSTSYDFVNALFEIHDPFKPAPETEEGKSLAASLGPTKDKYIEFTKKAIILYEEVRSRVIGIALSGAAPGEQFDIMLTSGH